VRTARRYLLAGTAVLALSAPGVVHAQWSQNGSVGPFLYTDPANWNNGIIDNTFSTAPANNLNVTWDADYTFTGGISLSYTGSNGITFRSDSATPRTLTMAGNWVRSNGAGTTTIGTVANPLIINLNGATRTFGGLNDSSFVIHAKITNTTGTAGVSLNNNQSYTYLRNNTNDFNGPVTFARRGGGFTSIADVGGGPSALGAPTTAANGLITVIDSTSTGSLSYEGGLASSNRNWQWNITGAGYSLINSGSGKLSLSGNFTFNSSTQPLGINASTADLDILGVISESGGVRTLNFTGGGFATRTITLGSTNTYSGRTTISGVTLVAPALRNAGTASSLGDATGSNATIGIGSAGTAAALRYTGSGDSTDRAIDLAGTTGGATLDASGTGAIVFTSPFTASGAGSKTLTLTGTNTALNEIRGAIVDNGGTNRTSVSKTGAGTWLLAGASTYTGDTTLTGGILRVTTLANTGTASAVGSAGTIRLNGGGLTYAGTGDSTNRTIAIGPATSAGGTGAVTATIRSSGSGPLSITGALDLGSFGNSGRTLVLAGTNVGANTLASTITDGQSSFSLSKTEAGRWIVSGTNSYTGGTTISAGTLVATSSSAFGTGVVTVAGGATLELGNDAAVANPITNAGTLAFAGGGIARTSTVAGGLGTTLNLLAGTPGSAVALNPALAWSAGEVSTFSDVLDLTNTAGTVQILRLTYAPAILGDVSPADLFLGWRNPQSDWVNAVLGNVGPSGGSAITAASGSPQANGVLANANFLGSWGRDTATNSVWAVVDHNSDFAVIAVPEPATSALLLAAVAAGLAGLDRRRRRREPAAQ